MGKVQIVMDFPEEIGKKLKEVAAGQVLTPGQFCRQVIVNYLAERERKERKEANADLTRELKDLKRNEMLRIAENRREIKAEREARRRRDAWESPEDLARKDAEIERQYEIMRAEEQAEAEAKYARGEMTSEWLQLEREERQKQERLEREKLERERQKQEQLVDPRIYNGVTKPEQEESTLSESKAAARKQARKQAREEREEREEREKQEQLEREIAEARQQAIDEADAPFRRGR